jgi:hypothetical protein
MENLAEEKQTQNLENVQENNQMTESGSSFEDLGANMNPDDVKEPEDQSNLDVLGE